MADARRPRKSRRARGSAGTSHAEPVTSPAVDDTNAHDASERSLGRAFALGLPAAGLLAAVVVGAVGGLGPALLVLAGTALLGTIGFFWASLRTLSGDAPLPEGVLATAAWSRAAPPEKKREVLRALKDLELEHSMGKIDDEDYRELSDRYRQVAKTLMRTIDADLAPRRKRAESLVESYLQKHGLDAAAAPQTTVPPEVPQPVLITGASASDADRRVACANCGTANELDAAFCKKCGSGLTSTQEKLDASA